MCRAERPAFLTVVEGLKISLDEAEASMLPVENLLGIGFFNSHYQQVIFQFSFREEIPKKRYHTTVVEQQESAQELLFPISFSRTTFPSVWLLFLNNSLFSSLIKHNTNVRSKQNLSRLLCSKANQFFTLAKKIRSLNSDT